MILTTEEPRTAQAGLAQKAPARGKWKHILFCFLPLMLFVMFALGILGRGYWLLLPVVFLQVVLPLADLMTGWQDDVHFEKSDFSPLEIALFKWIPRLYALLYMGSFIWLAMNIRRFTSVETVLLIVDSSLIAGICFAAAHELLHAKERIDQVLQRITTSFLFYPHYKLIHIRSHHVHVGTDHDENTAWLNESIYAYIFRTIPGSMIRSWRLESRQFAETSGGGVRIFRNKMFHYAVGQVGLLLALYLISGVWGLLFYAAHILGAHVTLESVNYIQHYGLLRKRREGEYEKTAAEHSWDTYHLFSSYATFRVGHHSYHHLEVKPYYLLGSEAAAPRLPVGYLWSMAMVLVPPWWRRVIHPKLADHARPQFASSGA
jgi:alkane 1-monooxygenase